MRDVLFLLTIILSVWLGFSSPIDPAQLSSEAIFRTRREPQYAKGQRMPNDAHTLLFKVKKGEYICGDRICKLKPGEVPKNCNGVCQYPV